MELNIDTRNANTYMHTDILVFKVRSHGASAAALFLVFFDALPLKKCSDRTF